MTLYDASLLEPIHSFLGCATPEKWVNHAQKNLEVLLIDHANCELKAAQTAIFLLRKYALTAEQAQELLDIIAPYEDFVYRQGTLPQIKKKNTLIDIRVDTKQSSFQKELIGKMLRLIKEELHHFDQVLDIMNSRNISYTYFPAGRYAKGLMKGVRTYEPQALTDKLIVGAFIEARSCERFAKIAPYLDDELQKFYISLLRSEARHYQDYLRLADLVSDEIISDRIDFFKEKERVLINTSDPHFCFHSGVPATEAVLIG